MILRFLIYIYSLMFNFTPDTPKTTGEFGVCMVCGIFIDVLVGLVISSAVSHIIETKRRKERK